MVHHDGNTRRVCGVDAVIRDTAFAALPALPDGSAIPTLAQVLARVAGRVPLIVEVKPEGGPVGNAQATLAALEGYVGPVCVESFHPMAVRYFRKAAPALLRGQLAMGYPRDPQELGVVAYFALKHLLVNALGRPHFIAYSSAQDRNLSMWLMKHLFKPPMAAWTLRTPEQLAAARRAYALPIFELFTPDRPA